MFSSQYASLLQLLDKLSVFSSSYETRVLASLITSATSKTASDLSDELDIPDSKVYPALNTLEDQGLIVVNDTGRPKKYYFDKPEYLKRYLDRIISTRFEHQQEIVEEISSVTQQLWDPEEYLLGNVAQLYRGAEIRNELARHLKLTTNQLFVFLSTNFSDYYDLLQEYIPQISHDQFRLHLVIPRGHEELLTHLEEQVRGKISLRTSIWGQNSYIIRDRKVMMNIFHSDQDVALLTNDELMVKNVENCWSDPECCTTTDLVDLQLPDDFSFSTIQLR